MLTEFAKYLKEFLRNFQPAHRIDEKNIRLLISR